MFSLLLLRHDGCCPCLSFPSAKISEIEEEQEDPYLNDRCRGEAAPWGRVRANPIGSSTSGSQLRSTCPPRAPGLPLSLSLEPGPGGLLGEGPWEAGVRSPHSTRLNTFSAKGGKPGRGEHCWALGPGAPAGRRL